VSPPLRSSRRGQGRAMKGRGSKSRLEMGSSAFDGGSTVMMTLSSQLLDVKYPATDIN
jgi:hypothetical protein